MYKLDSLKETNTEVLRSNKQPASNSESSSINNLPIERNRFLVISRQVRLCLLSRGRREIHRMIL